MGSATGQGKWIRGCFILGAVACIASASAGERNDILLAQIHVAPPPPVIAPMPVIPEVRVPDIRTPDLRTPDLRTPDLRTPDLRTPDLRTPDLRTPDLRAPELARIPAPVYPRGGGGNPPPVTSIPYRVPPACVLDSSNDSYGSGCSKRYIKSDVLYRDLYACQTAGCYANKLNSLLSYSAPPIVIIYPQAQAARVEARALIKTELDYAIGKMGEYLGDRKNNGVAGLPSISGIRDLMQSAKARLDAIDQPENESEGEALRRLGFNTPLKDIVNLVRST